MLFKEPHKPMILEGSKTATRRVWKVPRVKVGGVYKAKLKMLSKDYFAKIKVHKLFKQPLKDMTEEDAIKEGYPTLEKFKNVWSIINGNWDDELIVDVIEFERIEAEGGKRK